MNATLEQTAQFAVRRALPLSHHTGAERRGRVTPATAMR